jgi:hypothetical protein
LHLVWNQIHSKDIRDVLKIAKLAKPNETDNDIQWLIETHKKTQYKKVKWLNLANAEIQSKIIIWWLLGYDYKARGCYVMANNASKYNVCFCGH